MRNLIKEIEELKVETKYENDGYLDGVNEGVDKCLDILNQHNIITSPKQIMLSEILGKLNVNEWKDFQATKQENVISIDNNNCFREYLNIDKNKITDISDDMQTDEYKWLYSLWIAGTEIIDDLEEVGNVED